MALVSKEGNNVVSVKDALTMPKRPRREKKILDEEQHTKVNMKRFFL